MSTTLRSAPVAPVDAALLQQQFLEHWGLIMQMIRRRVRDPEEVQNVLCWAWILFADPAYLSNRCSKDRVVIAVIFATKRRRDAVVNRRRSTVDAMSHLAEYSPDYKLEHPIERDDCSFIRFEIENLPPRLQAVASLLSEGLNQKQASQQLGVCPRTVSDRVQDIAVWLIECSYYIPQFAHRTAC
jgi:hypothetical protein